MTSTLWMLDAALHGRVIHMRSALIALATAVSCSAAMAQSAEWKPDRYMEGDGRRFCKVLKVTDPLAKDNVVEPYVKAATKAKIDILFATIRSRSTRH